MVTSKIASPMLVKRPLGDWILAHKGSPVVVLEGARAVGKTTLVQKQFAETLGYHYENLSIRSVRERAQNDIASWLRSLPRPAILDEAQLIEELPIEVKLLVDELGPGLHFVLTGSSSIARTGLGGADPLARRSTRRTLHPLTRWEMARRPGSLVDLMFEGEVIAGAQGVELSDESLLNQLRVGGFPKYLLPAGVLTRSALRAGIASDMTALFSDSVMPDMNLNVTKARAALDELLRSPGGILNVSRLGKDTGLDNRTIERYIDIFGRLFLLQWLPNFATAPPKQAFSRAKIHPVDTAFAVDALERAGLSILEHREKFGQLLESHVACELIAQTQWSEHVDQVGYWRQSQGAKPTEVDLVLIDVKGREVAIEVESSTRINSSDLRGIRAFAASRNLYRGFIFYRGDVVQQLDTNIWALPFTALGDTEVFTQPMDATSSSTKSASTVSTPVTSDSDAAIFLSYVHKDDESLQGRVVRFVHDLADTYEFLFGGAIEVFTDRQIGWGDDWRDRLSKELGAATFLLAAVTPRYLKSAPCREEILEFSVAAGDARDRLLLPLLWAPLPEASGSEAQDPVRRLIEATQYRDVSEVRFLETGSAEYRKLLEQTAASLRETIVSRLTVEEPTSHKKVLEGEHDSGGLMDLLLDLAGQEEEISEATATFRKAMEAVSQAFAEAPQLPPDADIHATQAALQGMGERLAAPAHELDDAVAELGRKWEAFERVISDLVGLAPQLPQEIRSRLLESLSGLQRSLEIPGAEDMERYMTFMGSRSRHMRPVAGSLVATLSLARTIQSTVEIWIRTLSNA